MDQSFQNISSPSSSTKRRLTTRRTPTKPASPAPDGTHDNPTPLLARPELDHLSHSEPVQRVQKSSKGSSKATLQPPSPTPSSRRGGRGRSASAPPLDVWLSQEHRYLEEEIPHYTSADYTHAKVIKYLNKPLATTNNRAQVYIFEDPDRPSIIKIGSAQSPTDRKETLLKKCKFKALTSYFESDFLPEAWAWKVEQLAHYELGYFRRRFICGACTIRHREFFEIESEVAKKVIKKWIAFLESGLYGSDGELDERWKMKIHNYVIKNRPSQEHNDHESRYAWWEKLRDELVASNNVDAMDISYDKPNPETTPVLDNSRKSTTQPPARQPAGQEWPLLCIFHAVLLFLSSSNWLLRYFIYMPNLIGLVAVWVLVYLEALTTVRQELSHFRSSKSKAGLLH